MPFFAGLPLSQLLTAFAVAGGGVVLLYILKLKRRPVAVPFSRLWQQILRDKQATSLFSQLKRLLSLLLQLLLLGLILLAMGDPRTAVNLREGRNIVVLVDASASMQATDVSPSRLEAGKKKLQDVVRGLGASDRMLVAEMGASTTPLSTLTNDVVELERALEAVRPADLRADFPRALRFAQDTLRGLPSPEIIVVSDGALGEARDGLGAIDLGETQLSFVPVGEPGAKNVAITAFSVRRYPLDKSRYEAMIELSNLGADEVAVELRIFGDGLLNDTSRLRLKGAERTTRFLPSLSGASRQLRAELSLVDANDERLVTDDALPADNVAYALMPERRRARVQVVSPGNLYLDAALLLDEYLDVITVTPDRYPAEGKFDVTIFDGVAYAPSEATGHIFYLNPTGTNLPFTIDKEVKDDDPNVSLGFDEVLVEHPIVRHTELSDVNVVEAKTLKGQEGDKVVGASFRGPLLLAGRRAGYKFVALGFDVAASDLPLRISWPLLVLNVINDFVEEDASYLSSFSTGTVWRVPAPSQLESIRLEGPSVDKRIPVDEGRAVVFGDKAGFYSLMSDELDPVTAVPTFKAEFAANLSDPEESAIEPKSELVVGGKRAGEVAGFQIGVRRELWIYLLLAVLGISAIEWLTFHRRVTV
jgi:Ca-activated chloride channel homolog